MNNPNNTRDRTPYCPNCGERCLDEWHSVATTALLTPKPLKIVPAEPIKLEDERGFYSTEPKGDAEAMCQRLERMWFDPAAGARVFINPDGPEAAAFIRSLQQRNAELERALEPFAREADHYHEGGPDGWVECEALADVPTEIKVGDLWRAKEARAARASVKGEVE